MKKTAYFRNFSFILFLVFIGIKSQAGKGAYLKVYNLTNSSIKISSAKIGMSDFPNKEENINTSQIVDFGYIEESKWSSSSDFTIFGSNDQGSKCRIKIKIAGGTYQFVESDSDGLATFADITLSGDQYKVNVYITYPNNRWMTLNENIQKSTLSEFCMPGAHDAAMGKAEDCSTYANDKVTQTQDKSFREMLNLGVRYFDLRTILDNNGNWRFGHYSYTDKDITVGFLGFQGCMGYNLDDLLGDLANFLSENGNKELVVLEFSHFVNLKRDDLKTSTKYDKFNDKVKFTDEDFKSLVAKINSKLNGHLVITNSTDLTNIKVRDLTAGKGKALVLIDDNNFNANPVNGAYPLSYLKPEGEYANKDSFEPMKKDQLEKLARRKVDSNFQTSWTLTHQGTDNANFVACFADSKWYTYFNIPFKIWANSRCVSIREMAMKANDQLFELVNAAKSENKYPNVLYTDYVSNEKQIVVSTLLNLK